MFFQAVKKVKKSRLSQFQELQGQSLFFLNNVENSMEKKASISGFCYTIKLTHNVGQNF